MAIQTHVCTDFETQKTFRITVLDEKNVIGLQQFEDCPDCHKPGHPESCFLNVAEPWVDVPESSEWWEQWQGEAESGAFETPDIDPSAN